MVRTCQADDALEKQFEDLLRRQGGSEIGLLVGKYAAGSKALIYSTIRTPSQDGLHPILVSAPSAAPAARSARGASARTGAVVSSGTVNVVLEAEWITEHARQVARMLPGGLSVLGLYVFAPESAATAAAPQLATLLAALARLCLPYSPSYGSLSATAAADAPADVLLLHIDAGSRKHTLRALPAGPAAPRHLAATSASSSSSAAAAPAPSAAAFRPCELRFGPTLGSLVLLRCWHGIDLTLPVTGSGSGPASGGTGGGGGGGSGSMQQQLAAVVAAEAERIRLGVFASTSGSLLSETAPVGEALAASTPPAPTPPSPSTALTLPTYDLTLLAPTPCRQLAQDRAVGDGRLVVGCVRLRGCVQGLALVGRREAACRAMGELKSDLLSTLTNRLELLVEEAGRAAEQQQEGQGQGGGSGADCAPPAVIAHPLLASPGQLGGGYEVALPRRVVLPWLGGSLALCDYLVEGEAAEAAAERAVELLGLQGEQLSVFEAEKPAPPASVLQPWQPNALPGTAAAAADSCGKGAGGAGLGLGGLRCGAALMASVAVAAAASAVGLMSLAGQTGR